MEFIWNLFQCSLIYSDYALQDGRSALFMAAETGDIQCAQLLIDAGSDLSIIDNVSKSIMNASCQI